MSTKQELINKYNSMVFDRGILLEKLIKRKSQITELSSGAEIAREIKNLNDQYIQIMSLDTNIIELGNLIISL
jgi:hypothetical protein